MTYTYDAGSSTPVSAGLAEFGGVRINDGTYLTYALRGLRSTPGVRVTRTGKAQGHGAFIGGSFHDGRDIGLDLVARVPVLADLDGAIDGIGAAFNLINNTTVATLKFQYPGFSEARFVSARLNGSIVVEDQEPDSQFAPWRLLTIPLICPDPRIYSFTTQHAIDIAVSATVNMPNAGNFPAPLVIRLTGPGTNWRVIDDTNSHEVDYDGTITAGHYVDIDTLARTVTDDLGANKRATVGRWDNLVIQPGTSTTTLRLLVSSGTSGATKATATYRDVWMT